MAANSLSYQFKTANIAIKLIVINVAIFILFNLIPALFGQSFSFARYFMLPSSLGAFITQPWSLVTYEFLHSGFWHLLWNMYFLYLFSRFVLNLFTEKRLLTLYLLGGIYGGLLYMLSYNIFPTLMVQNGILVGASGCVMAIVVFIGTYTPNNSIRFFVFNIKLWQIAAFFVLSDLIRVATGNANTGGLITHLGGAAFGYLYAIQLAKGNDIGGWFERIMDSVAGLFSGKPREKKSRMRTVHRNKKTAANSKTKSSDTKSAKQQQIDAILDKISKSGYDSLSKAEKDFLFKAGNED